jgi:hypothetical protein
MAWVRLDENFARHPKVLAAGPLGMAMQVAALCYANQYLTDGFIPRSVVPGLIDLEGLGMRLWHGEITGGGEDADWTLVVEDLIGAGLWEKVNGGFRIHDYHDYQPSKEEVLALREKRSAAGQKGGQASAKTRARPSAEALASATGAATAQAKSKPVPVPVPVTTTTKGANAPVAQARPVSVETRQVFEEWQQATGKTKARLDEKRRHKIQQALKAYPLEDVIDAVRGWQHDPWPERPRHIDLTVLLRDAAHIEKFRDLWRDGPPATTNGRAPVMNHLARRYADAIAKEQGA